MCDESKSHATIPSIQQRERLGDGGMNPLSGCLRGDMASLARMLHSSTDDVHVRNSIEKPEAIIR